MPNVFLGSAGHVIYVVLQGVEEIKKTRVADEGDWGLNELT